MRALLFCSALAASALLLSRPAEACSPAFATITDTSPADGAAGVPGDAVIRVYFGGGYTDFGSAPEVTITADGEAVSGAAEGWSRTIDLVEQQGLITFTPDAPLPAGAVVAVEVESAKGGPHAFSFTVSEGAAAVASAAPTLSLDRLEHFTIDPGQMSSCDDEAWWEVDWAVTPNNADPDSLSIIEIHKVSEDTDAELGEPLRVIGPIGEEGSATLSSRYRVDLSAGSDPTAECFVAVMRDGAGNPSPPSAMVCGEPAPEDTGGGDDTGEGDAEADGCSSVPLAASVWGALLALGAAAGRRRRRSHR